METKKPNDKFEAVIRFIVYRIFHFKFSEGFFQGLVQLIKFGVVGLSNTIISYGLYVVFYDVLQWHYQISNLLSFSISVVNSFFWNSRYVFVREDREKEPWWLTFIKTYVSYAGTGLILTALLLKLFIEVWGINGTVAPLLCMVFTIPINYIANKFWAYRKKKTDGKDNAEQA